MKSFIDLLIQSLPLLTEGALLTLKLTVFSLILATIVGLISCLFGMNKYLKYISGFYISVIRGTPILVQVFFIYFSFPGFVQMFGKTIGIDPLAGFRLSAYAAGVISLTLNSGAYLSEIFRGGIQAVSKGQMEAARSLGMSYSHAMAKVILPQALKISIPSVVNQFIICLKDTSIISTIGLAELMWQGKQIVSRNFRSAEIYLIVGVYYFIMIFILTKISRYIERRLS